MNIYSYTLKKLVLLSFLIMFSSIGFGQTKVPEFLTGKFTDDYGIKYTITDSVWTQEPRTKFHIIKWDIEGQYIIARNGEDNRTEPGLYTRIDFMQFKGMEPFLWGFCLTAYKAKTEKEAEATINADRVNPKKGCNGFPFSRMKRID